MIAGYLSDRWQRWDNLDCQAPRWQSAVLPNSGRSARRRPHDPETTRLARCCLSANGRSWVYRVGFVVCASTGR